MSLALGLGFGAVVLAIGLFIFAGLMAQRDARRAGRELPHDFGTLP